MKNPQKTRSEVIVKSGILFILVNFLLSIFNLIIGLISGSIAIISDALHSFIDATSGFLIIISEKLAERPKFKARRAKIERATTIIIALIIIAAGIHIGIESFEKLANPEPLEINAPVIIILVISIAMKLEIGRAHV